MQKSSLALGALLALAVSGCEDGPTRIYTPLDTDPPLQSGDGWTQPGRRDFDGFTEGDSAGRARFCDEAQATALIGDIVDEPIIPDVSLGRIPLWSPDGQPLHADALLGLPSDGKFCDATESYADAFVWGPTSEIIVFFNQETRLVEGVMAYQSYLGLMRGSVTIGETTEEIVVQPRERVTVGGVELDEYASRSDEGARARSWLNHRNVTKLYGMIRQTFFGDEPLPAGYDCIAEQRCDVIYTASDESVPQDTFIDIPDSGVQLRFTPDGHLIFVFLSPVRKADFELFGELSFGPPGRLEVAPRYDSGSVDGCNIDLGARDTMSWADFQARCVTAERTLSRASYDVYTQRDAVTVGFDGITLGFLRRTSESGVFHDGERPAETDRLFSIEFTRSLSATVPQFVPRTLAEDYAERLAAHLAASLDPSARMDHPFASFALPVDPGLSEEPQRIGEILYITEAGEESSWVPDALAYVRSAYDAMSPEERAVVDADALSDVALLEPFVAAVMSAFSFGISDDPASFQAFQTTDDERWVIGFGSFVQGGEPYRLIVQYSLNFGAITAISVERGESEVDAVFSRVNRSVWEALGAPAPSYYDMRIAAEAIEMNPLRLGGTGIEVGDVDRTLATLDVTLVLGEGDGDRVELTVPGTALEDRAGFLRQLRGQRYEFVPAHAVTLYGKETIQVFHVLEDGTIGRIEQRVFKGSQVLCIGPSREQHLRVRFGTDVRDEVEAWRARVGDDVYSTCELVFNYSPDGHVLNGVASLTNRVELMTVAGRATTIAVWR
jgi:hypothetical protein